MKQLRKDDGYVMVYVLIVFTILSLVAVSICNMALRNLQAQKADVARMEARYEAEGYLQQFVAQLEELTGEEEVGPALNATESAAMDQMREAFLAEVHGLATAQLTIDDATPERVVVRTVSDDDAVEIHAELQIALDCTTTGGPIEEGETPQHVYTCKLNKATVTAYTSYDISYQTADNGEEGNAG